MTSVGLMRLKVISMRKELVRFEGAIHGISIRAPWEAFEVLGKVAYKNGAHRENRTCIISLEGDEVRVLYFH